MDSMLVYRGLDVGTAKPAQSERGGVPHHLIDLVDPSASFSVQDWLARAREALAEIAQRGRRALFVGGTAFYLKALTEGLFEGPPVNPRLRAELEGRFDAEGGEALHAELLPKGVILSVVNPGFVRTPLTDRNAFPMPFLVDADTAARRIVDGLATDRFEVTFPRRFAYLMKLLRILPYGLFFAITRRLRPAAADKA